MVKGHFLRGALYVALTTACLSGPALAEHLDPAPIPDEVVQSLVHNRLAQPDPLVQSLFAHLDDAGALIREFEQQNGRPDSEAGDRDAILSTKRALLSSKINELEAARAEARARFATTRAKLQSLGLTDKLNEWNKLASQVENRFDRIEHALDAVRTGSDKGVRTAALSHAKAELRTMHEDVKARSAAPLDQPIPSWHQDAPRPPLQEPASDKLPQYLSYQRNPGNNVYAFLGNTLLAAVAPPTPASDASCGSPTDLTAALAATVDAPLSTEIQNLAASLGYSPVKIFQYVSQNIKFEPYYGSLKGATGVLYTHAGNATDQASLLIALLRASNIPARYVKGQIQVNDGTPASDGGRAGHWLGAKSYAGAAGILTQGLNPFAGLVNNASSQATGVTLTHVWVEACVPYSHYRGTQGDTAGSRWIPLDPSFKNATYQAGIATNVPFNAADYTSVLSNTLPEEIFAGKVETAIKALAPNYANNTLADAPYTGTPLPLTIDVLPASMPYEVTSFLNWDGTSSPEAASLPDSHRYKFNVGVNNSAGTSLLSASPVVMSLPQTALNRVTVSFQGATASDVAALSAWQNDGNLATATPCTVNVVPVVKAAVNGVEGTVVATGSGAVGLCSINNQITMSVVLDEVTTVLHPTVNTITYTNIGAANNHALQAYAFQASDRLLTERAAKLIASVKATANPDSNLEETEGEFLHIAGLKYMRYLSDGAKHIGQLDGGSGESGTHLGLVSSAMKVQYLFDLPFSVYRAGYLVDMLGVLSRSVDLTTGQSVWKTFLLSGYNGSALESYIWQENVRQDAVSTVRGLQYANANGIQMLTLNSGNWAAQSPLLTSNTNTALNYPATGGSSVATIKASIDAGYTVTLPRSLIQWNNWTGAVWEQEFNDTATGKMHAGFLIGGNYAGGYLLGNTPISTTTYDLLTGTGYVPPATTFSSLLSNTPGNQLTLAGLLGVPFYSAGDPVNMLTGNMYHTERDISIKGRGGLPIVFERSYNSHTPQNGPLGYGWTHSLNHYLKFYGVDADGKVKASWTNGSGAEKFFSATPISGGIATGTVMTNSPGIFVTFQRLANGTYTITEKNGLTYTFASNAGTTNGQTSPLQTIRDRNGNTLTMNYTGANLTTVTDGFRGNVLTIAYDTSTPINRITSITDMTGRVYQYGYTDSNGNLNSFKNPLAVASSNQPPVTYQYYTAADGANLNHAMKTYTLPRGNGMTFEYYTNGKVFRHTTSPNNEINTFTYNDFRREAIQVNERGLTRRFFFDQYGNASQIVEENGGTRSYTYDTATPANVNNRLTKRDPEGYVTSYVYDSKGNVIQITNPSTGTVTFANFTAFNQPGKIKDANGNYTLLKFDAQGNQLQDIHLKQSYCTANNCVTLDPAAYNPTAADMLAWNVKGYDGYGNLLSAKRVRDFTGQVAANTALSNTGPIVSTTYDANSLFATAIARTGIKNSEASPTTQSAALTFDSLGRLKTGIDGDWYATSFSYDAADRMIQGTDALGNLRSYQYDANGNPLGQSLAVMVNGVSTLIDSTSASYDPSDRKERSLDTAGNTTAYQYDSAGNVLKITNPDNYSLAFEYDANNHVIKAYDQANHSVSRTLDLDGKPRTITDPNNNTVRYVYYDSTGDGRLKTVTDAANHSTTYGYDLNGNPTSVTITGNDGTTTRTTLTQYDELNRPIRIVGPQYTDTILGAIRPVTKYVYDTLGNRTQVLANYTTDLTGLGTAQDNLKTQVTDAFDDFGRNIKETDPLGKFWSTTYDSNNNVTQVIDAKNQITSYIWGYGHQLTSRTATGDAIGYARNTLGQVLIAQSPTVTYRYSYDPAHRLQSVTDSRANKKLTYSYSPGGLLNKMLDSDNNETDYLYDPVGRLSGIWAPNLDYVSFNYDNGGRLTEKWFPNGVDTQYNWNADNTLASLTNKMSSTVISSHIYTYDVLGNRQTNTETVNGVATPYKYVYDELNRLTEVRNNSTSALIESTSYDPLNNRLAKSNGVTVTAYVYDSANQLKEIHSGSTAGPLLASLSYDFNGSLTSRTDTGLALVYDGLNRLTQATLGTTVSSYAYDDQDRRIQKTVAGTASNFLYSGPDIIAEYAAAWGTPTAQYTHGPNTDDPLIRATATTAQYFHQDGLGSLVALTSTGGTDATQRFDAWGNKLASSGTQPRYGYTGREPDAESGLTYYRARYYDASIGRFTQRDQIGLNGGINLYAYTSNNPINFTDPSGNCVGPLARACIAGAQWLAAKAVPAAVNWARSTTTLIAAKASAGFALGYEGAKLTGTESELGRIGAGIVGALGLGGSTQFVAGAAARLGGGTAAKVASTVALSGATGSGAEFAAQEGDKVSGVGPGHLEIGKIFGMGAVTTGASLLGGEAAMAGLGFEGGVGAVADIWGATNTAVGAFIGNKAFYTAEQNTGTQSLTGFNPAPPPKH
jgi:RHS repeat-associated protein